MTTNRRYHKRLCLEAWNINSTHAPLNRNNGGLLLDAYVHHVRKKGQLIRVTSEHTREPLVAAIRSLLMKPLNRRVETLAR